MPTLFEIGDEIVALHDLLTECEGELPNAEAEAAIDDWLAETNVAPEIKVDGYGALIREYEARAEAREVEAKRLMALAGADGNNVRRLKDRLKQFFEANGITKLETRRFRFTIAKNGGMTPLVFPQKWEREPASAPERYHLIRIDLNKAMLREDAEATELEMAKLSDALAAGHINPQEYNDALHVAEMTNVVRLGERGTHLRLR